MHHRTTKEILTKSVRGLCSDFPVLPAAESRHVDAGRMLARTGSDNRAWKFMSDASINCQKKQERQTVPASGKYSVEMVSPVLMYYQDISTLQGLVRCLRKAGGFANPSCGIHIHLDGANHTPRSIRNFVNIIASKNDLLYKALQIEPARMRYCKKMDAYLVEQLNQQKPTDFAQIESIWYAPYSGNPNQHYHTSRYHFLNLHSFFHGHNTVELRGFNGTLHAGKIRAYIVLALALNHQALTQKYSIFTFIKIIIPFQTPFKIMNIIALIPLFFANIRGWQLIIILLVILLLFGGKKIPELMRGLGKGVNSFKQGLQEAKEELEKPVEKDDKKSNDKSDAE